MGSWQTSHLVRKVRGLNGPAFDAWGPLSIVAVGGLPGGLPGDRGLRGMPGSSEASCARGSSLWVQHWPWFTQLLQYPQSPSLQSPQRQ